MSTPNSGRNPKSSRSGNGIYPPHMQSSLSPQGFGLYSSGGGGDAMSIHGPTGIASGLSPLKKETLSYNDYLSGPGSHQASLAGDGDWKNATGNENLTAYTSAFGGGPGGSSRGGTNGNYLNITNTPRSLAFDSGDFRNASNANGKVLEKSQQQPHDPQRQYYPNSNNSFSGTVEAAPGIHSIRGNIGAEDAELDRNRKKDLLIDSLTKSDMITCLPGFKKRASQFTKPIWADVLNKSRLGDRAIHHPNIQGRDQNENPSSPLPSGPAVLHSSYPRQTPASLSPILSSREQGRVNQAGSSYNYNQSANFFNANFDKGNAQTERRASPPPSPVSRAKVAIGRAQNEISKINSFVEEEEDRKRLPGAWKNMGTPSFSEPLTKSVQRQQKAQYRMDLERQIHASKLRKAEEERQERDNNNHPLGRDYAHPALNYYNPPHRIPAGDQDAHSGGTPPAAVALTQYMKEKYCIEVPSGDNAIPTTPGYPPEVGFESNGGLGVQGRIAPLQQKKKEKALANLMKSRMHPGDQHKANTPRLLPMNQLQTGGARLHNGRMTQPGNGSSFPQHQNQPPQAFGHGNLSRGSIQQQQSGWPSQCASYPTGTAAAAYQSRPYGMATATGWPMPMYSPYAPYYGQYSQPIYPNANQSQVNPVQPVPQSFPQQHYPPSSQQSIPPSPQLYDRFNDDDEDVEDTDQEFEALKEKTNKPQRIWQTSDELPDPGLRTAVYKAELRKQIDEDRKRKADRVAREREEDERIERKIREFHEDERRRMEMEQQTRAELEGRFHQHRKTKIEKHRKRNEALTIPRQEMERRPRSRSSLLAEKLAQYGPNGDCGDSEDPQDEADPFYKSLPDNFEKYCDYSNEQPHQDLSLMTKISESVQPVRKSSPPVPVVQKKLMDSLFIDESSGKSTPQRQICALGQNFLLQLKSKLSSERDIVERRLQEKLESTHKNMNLLKYTMSKNQLKR